VRMSWGTCKVYSRGHQGIVAGKGRGLRSQLVDREVVDNGLHGEWDAALHLAPGLAHDGLHADLGLRFSLRVEQESHAAAAHSPEHPEAPEIVTEFNASTVDQRGCVQIAGPGNDGLDRALEVALEATAERSDVAPLEMTGDLIKDCDGLLAADPLGFTAQQVLLGDHFKNGADILRHPTVDEDKALLKFSRASRGTSASVKIL